MDTELLQLSLRLSHHQLLSLLIQVYYRGTWLQVHGQVNLKVKGQRVNKFDTKIKHYYIDFTIIT